MGKKPTWPLQGGARRRLLPAIIKGIVLGSVLGYLLFATLFSSQSMGSTSAIDPLRKGAEAQALPRDDTHLRAPSASRRKIAYVISVTADGPYMDGAAVLAYGILKTSQDSRFEPHLIAFVHPEVSKSRQPLERAGWRLVEKDIPVNIDEIRGDFLREKIRKNGCCGASELLKLYSWTLVDYHRVVHLDMDSLVLQPMDELYDQDKDLVYTCDYGMMTKGSKACPVQGGFFVLKPSMETFEQLVEVVKEGDYRDGGAWGGSNIGWFWGGMTIQGLLPYFFLYVRDPSASLEADRCVYNNMFDNPECKNISVPLVKNVHFTVCQKPWSCYKHDKNVRCNVFLDRWFELRTELEMKEAGSATQACEKEKYRPLDFLSSPDVSMSA